MTTIKPDPTHPGTGPDPTHPGTGPDPTHPGHTTSDDLRNVHLPLEPNEASGMALVTDDELLARLDWSIGFWVCLDDGPVERCVALVGHPASSRNPNDWEIRRLEGEVQNAGGSTEDCEAVAVWDGWVYVFGSQFGSKGGPLERKRQFVARFREGDVEPGDDRITVAMQLWEAEFVLHRLVNDALRRARIDLLPLGPKTHKAFIAGTRARAVKKDRRWLHRLRHDDVMVNIEGAAFLGDATLVLGLRQPVTGDGHPLVIEVRGIDRVFTDGEDALSVPTVWVIENLGSRSEHVGVRDLAAYGQRLDLLVGNVEAVGEGSVFLSEHPEGGRAASTHWFVDLEGHREGGPLHATFVRGFGPLKRIEGLASAPNGEWFYVSDEDHAVQTRFTMGSWHIDDEGIDAAAEDGSGPR